MLKVLESGLPLRGRREIRTWSTQEISFSYEPEIWPNIIEGKTLWFVFVRGKVLLTSPSGKIQRMPEIGLYLHRNGKWGQTTFNVTKGKRIRIGYFLTKKRAENAQKKIMKGRGTPGVQKIAA